MDIKIKSANLINLDELCKIEKESFREEAFTRSQIANLLTECNAVNFTARTNMDTAGFVIALVEIARKRSFGHILTIDVLPRYRRLGIAEKLLQAVEMDLRKKGISECRLEVREDNIAALNLYLKLGYQKVGRLEKYYRGKHGLYLRKTL